MEANRAACLVLVAYCIQYSFLGGRLVLPGAYEVALLMLVLMVLANFQGVRFQGLDIVPPNKALNLIFWGSFLVLAGCFVSGVGEGASVARTRPAHFVVGLGLFVFFGLSFWGSFFSGFGVYLFLRSPISWLRDKLAAPGNRGG